MATLTQTEIELSPLDRHNSKPASTTIATAREGHVLSPQSQIIPLVEAADHEAAYILPKGRSIITTIQLAGINFITSYNTGLVTVGLPAMSKSLNIHPDLVLWPMSAYTLAMGTCLLPAGAISDILGNRISNLFGCFFIATFLLASGFAQTPIQLIMFRAMQGVAAAFAIPSSLSIISRSIESGPRRNFAFSCLGLAQPLGFSIGLVSGGLFVSGPGWRVGSYVAGAAGFALFLIGLWVVPRDIRPRDEAPLFKRLSLEVDWVGAGLASFAIAVLSYFLAVENIKHPSNVVLLVLSLIAMPLFALWMKHQERMNKPALIPNSLWRKRTFTCICLMVLLSNALIFGMELFSSLFFQQVQGLSALETSLRFMPNVLSGVITNFTTGMFVDKVPAVYAVLISSLLCCVAPLLMALVNPTWPFWYDEFFAQFLAPLSVDVLFTVGILIISDVFPARTQALAGAVFNTVAQLGTSIGLCTLQVISVVATRESRFASKQSPEALMEGYKASFWTILGFGIASCFVGAFGLRRLGKIGEKRD